MKTIFLKRPTTSILVATIVLTIGLFEVSDVFSLLGKNGIVRQSFLLAIFNLGITILFDYTGYFILKSKRRMQIIYLDPWLRYVELFVCVALPILLYFAIVINNGAIAMQSIRNMAILYFDLSVVCVLLHLIWIAFCALNRNYRPPEMSYVYDCGKNRKVIFIWMTTMAIATFDVREDVFIREFQAKKIANSDSLGDYFNRQEDITAIIQATGFCGQ